MIESMSPRCGGGVVSSDGERAGSGATGAPADAGLDGQHVDVVAAFVEFVLRDEGRAVVAEYGFGSP